MASILALPSATGLFSKTARARSRTNYKPETTNSRSGPQRGARVIFLPPDDTVLPALRAVSDWASGQGYRPAAIATFLQVADYWPIAHAPAHECIVATLEVPADTTSRIKIPNACIGLNLRCMNRCNLRYHWDLKLQWSDQG